MGAVIFFPEFSCTARFRCRNFIHCRELQRLLFSEAFRLGLIEARSVVATAPSVIVFSEAFRLGLIAAVAGRA